MAFIEHLLHTILNVLSIFTSGSFCPFFVPPVAAWGSHDQFQRQETESAEELCRGGTLSQASLGLIHVTHAPALRPCLDVCRLHPGLGTVGTFTFPSPLAFSASPSQALNGFYNDQSETETVTLESEGK